jgi:hypothetical protein
MSVAWVNVVLSRDFGLLGNPRAARVITVTNGAVLIESARTLRGGDVDDADSKELRVITHR